MLCQYSRVLGSNQLDSETVSKFQRQCVQFNWCVSKETRTESEIDKDRKMSQEREANTQQDSPEQREKDLAQSMGYVRLTSIGIESVE